MRRRRVFPSPPRGGEVVASESEPTPWGGPPPAGGRAPRCQVIARVAGQREHAAEAGGGGATLLFYILTLSFGPATIE